MLSATSALSGSDKKPFSFLPGFEDSSEAVSKKRGLPSIQKVTNRPQVRHTTPSVSTPTVVPDFPAIRTALINKLEEYGKRTQSPNSLQEAYAKMKEIKGVSFSPNEVIPNIGDLKDLCAVFDILLEGHKENGNMYKCLQKVIVESRLEQTLGIYYDTTGEQGKNANGESVPETKGQSKLVKTVKAGAEKLKVSMVGGSKGHRVLPLNQEHIQFPSTTINFSAVDEALKVSQTIEKANTRNIEVSSIDSLESLCLTLNHLLEGYKKDSPQHKAIKDFVQSSENGIKDTVSIYYSKANKNFRALPTQLTIIGNTPLAANLKAISEAPDTDDLLNPVRGGGDGSGSPTVPNGAVTGAELPTTAAKAKAVASSSSVTDSSPSIGPRRNSTSSQRAPSPGSYGNNLTRFVSDSDLSGASKHSTTASPPAVEKAVASSRPVTETPAEIKKFMKKLQEVLQAYIDSNKGPFGRRGLKKLKKDIGTSQVGKYFSITKQQGTPQVVLMNYPTNETELEDLKAALLKNHKGGGSSLLRETDPLFKEIDSHFSPANAAVTQSSTARGAGIDQVTSDQTLIEVREQLLAVIRAKFPGASWSYLFFENRSEQIKGSMVTPHLKMQDGRLEWNKPPTTSAEISEILAYFSAFSEKHKTRPEAKAIQSFKNELFKVAAQLSSNAAVRDTAGIGELSSEQRFAKGREWLLEEIKDKLEESSQLKTRLTQIKDSGVKRYFKEEGKNQLVWKERPTELSEINEILNYFANDYSEKDQTFKDQLFKIGAKFFPDAQFTQERHLVAIKETIEEAIASVKINFEKRSISQRILSLATHSTNDIKERMGRELFNTTKANQPPNVEAIKDIIRSGLRLEKIAKKLEEGADRAATRKLATRPTLAKLITTFFSSTTAQEAAKESFGEAVNGLTQQLSRSFADALSPLMGSEAEEVRKLEDVWSDVLDDARAKYATRYPGLPINPFRTTEAEQNGEAVRQAFNKARTQEFCSLIDNALAEYNTAFTLAYTEGIFNFSVGSFKGDSSVNYDTLLGEWFSKFKNQSDKLQQVHDKLVQEAVARGKNVGVLEDDVKKHLGEHYKRAKETLTAALANAREQHISQLLSLYKLKIAETDKGGVRASSAELLVRTKRAWTAIEQYYTSLADEGFDAERIKALKSDALEKIKVEAMGRLNTIPYLSKGFGNRFKKVFTSIRNVALGGMVGTSVVVGGALGLGVAMVAAAKVVLPCLGVAVLGYAAYSWYRAYSDAQFRKKQKEELHNYLTEQEQQLISPS